MTEENQLNGVEIIERIKNVYGSVAAFAEEHQIKHDAVIYQSAWGKGSRYGRLKIAKLMKCLPSELWDDGTLMRFRDDKAFLDTKKV